MPHLLELAAGGEKGTWIDSHSLVTLRLHYPLQAAGQRTGNG